MLMPLSGKEMRKLFLEAGYEIDPGGGKGMEAKEKREPDSYRSEPQNFETRYRTLLEETLEVGWRKN